MNEILSIFLLGWDTCISEIHLKQSGFTYSACRPFTKNKEYKNIMKAGLAILKEQPCFLKQTELSRKWKKDCFAIDCWSTDLQATKTFISAKQTSK